MVIDSIQDGIVIDHIKAGKGMEIYRLLELDQLDCQVAIIQNAFSHKEGKKDVIKIDSPIRLNLDILGYLDPDCTVNIITGGTVAQKYKLSLPQRITGVIRCRNPRCITSVEQELPQIFRLTDPENKTYRCIYCDTRAKRH